MGRNQRRKKDVLKSFSSESDVGQSTEKESNQREKEKFGNQGGKENEKIGNRGEEENGSNQRVKEKKMGRKHRMKIKKKKMLLSITIDDYKVVVFDDCNITTYPFRTFSLDETLPPRYEYFNIEVGNQGEEYFNSEVGNLGEEENKMLLSTTEFNRTVTIDDYKLVVFYDCNKTNSVSLDETLPPDGCISLKASWNGLVCAAVSFSGKVELMLMNPFTGTSKLLPSIPNGLSAKSDPVGFYTDPSDNNNNDDFKLVCVPHYGNEGAYVYSHRLNEWKHIEFPIPLYLQLCCWSPPTIYRQYLYFEITRPSFNRIIRFDMKTETFKEIPVPKLTYQTDATCLSFLGLVVLEGCLHIYVSYNINDVSVGVDVWRIKDDGDEWESVNAFTVDLCMPEHLFICSTETSDNWLAVWDKDVNSFKKMSTQEFTQRYHTFHSTLVGPQDRLIYVQTRVDP